MNKINAQIKHVFIILFFAAGNCISGIAQNMEHGFELLNNGDFTNATIYFDSVSKLYPDNTTAKLCYARATGLSGRPAQAQLLFGNMLKSDPDNLEVKINYAESFLWQKEFDAAVTYYSDLKEVGPESFAINLGLANAHAGAKQVDKALEQINNTLKLKPTDASALNSLKYIRLAKASQLVEASLSTQAILLLEKNLAVFKGDAPTLNTLANVYLKINSLDSALATYSKHLNPIEKNIGLSLIWYKKGFSKKALNYAQIADSIAVSKTNSPLLLQAKERLVQALLWNAKLQKAKAEITVLYSLFGRQEAVLALDAEHNMYMGNFKTSTQLYLEILDQNPSSFNGNLGIANAYRAQFNYSSALDYANNTLTYYPNQKDALALVSKINERLKVTISPFSSYTQDNAKNTAYQTGIRTTVPLSYQLTITGQYLSRTTQNKPVNYKASSESFQVGLRYRAPKNVEIGLSLGAINAILPNDSYTNLEGQLQINIQPLARQNISLSVSRNLQAFNAQLIEQKIFMNTASLSHNIMSSFRLGWYSNYQFTKQTDGNTRHLLFSSVYYSTPGKHTLKFGANYQYMGFILQRPEIYYSPKTYQSIDGFVEANGTLGKLSYRGLAAFGRQYDASMNGTNSFRGEAQLSMPVAQNFRFNAYAKYSNVAAQITSGFSFTELGISLIWKPFKLRKNSL